MSTKILAGLLAVLLAATGLLGCSTSSTSEHPSSAELELREIRTQLDQLRALLDSEREAPRRDAPSERILWLQIIGEKADQLIYCEDGRPKPFAYKPAEDDLVIRRQNQHDAARLWARAQVNPARETVILLIDIGPGWTTAWDHLTLLQTFGTDAYTAMGGNPLRSKEREESR